MIKLTYIVLVYNSAETIIRTLESIYCQPWGEDEYEVIVVDDCSPDNSSELVTEFAKVHTNLTLVRQKQNHRAGTSLNIGIKIAKGAYIQAVGGDDLIEEGIVAAVNQNLKEDVDVSLDTCSQLLGNGELQLLTPTDYKNFPMSGKEFCEKVFETSPEFGGSQFYLWKTDFLRSVGHPFVEEKKMEDTDWVEYHLPLAKRIGYNKQSKYVYVYNSDSQVHKPSITTLADFVLQCYRRLEVSKKYAEEFPVYAEKIKSASDCRIANFLRYRNLTKFSNSDYVVLYKRLGDDVRRELAQNEYPRFTKLFLKHKYTTLILLWSTAWVSRWGRAIVHKIRRNK